MSSIPEANGLWLPDSRPWTTPLDLTLAGSTLIAVDQSYSFNATCWADTDWVFYWSGPLVPPAVPTSQPANTFPLAFVPNRALLEVQYRRGMVINPGGSGVVTVAGFRAFSIGGGAGTLYINDFKRVL